jgi:plasmid stabilization system protein ParE
MRRVLLRQVAIDELADITEFMADDKPAAARRVLEAVERCIDHIAAFPESAPLLTNVLRQELKGIRRAVVTPFRTIVLF